MSATEIRPITPADTQAHRSLMAHAFAHGRVVPEEPPSEGAEEYGRNVWGLFAGGTLEAALTIVPYEAHWGGETVLPLGGIAGVATFAQARGQGHVDALLRQSLRAMRDAGQVISALYPFSWAFYRRHGWEWVGEKRSVSVPLREVRSSPEGKRVAPVTGDAVQETLTPVYTEFARRYRGVFTSETHRWKDSLAHHDNRTTYAYAHSRADAGDKDGYLLWRYETSGDKGRVREFIANTPEAFTGLMSLLHYFGTQCATARLNLPADSPVWAHVMHWDVETRAEPVFMGRVVDVARALERLPGQGIENGSATLHVRDEQASWNNGTWRVAVEEGRISCAAAVAGGDAGEADVSLDIQAFSQAFWGTPSLEWLRGAGRVEVRGEAGYAFLTRVLPPAPVFTLDDF